MLWRITDLTQTGWVWGSPAAKVNVCFVTVLLAVTVLLSWLLEQMVFSSLRRAPPFLCLMSKFLQSGKYSGDFKCFSCVR